MHAVLQYERLSKIRSLIAVLQGQDVLSFRIQILLDYLCVLDDYAEGAHKTLAELDILQRQWIHSLSLSAETNQNSTQSELCQPSGNLYKKEAK